MAGFPPTITDGSVTLTFGSAGIYYGYCTVADVAFEFPNKGSFSTLTNSTIAQEITYAAQELQQQLDTVYVMPYVGTNGGILLTLRDMNAKMATANLIDRYFQGMEPDMSPAAAERRSYAELKVVDVIHGLERWGPEVGGDAIARAMNPVYNLATGASIVPNPNDPNLLNANPIFSMSISRYRRSDII